MQQGQVQSIAVRKEKCTNTKSGNQLPFSTAEKDRKPRMSQPGSTENKSKTSKNH